MTAVLALVLLAVVLSPPRRAGRPCRVASPVRSGGPATLDDAASALTMLAAVLRGGSGAVECLEAVAAVDEGSAGRELAVVAAAHRWGESPDGAWARVGPGWAPAAAAWHAALAAGAAPAGLLEDAAARMRASEARRVEAAVHRAGVLLVLPLGACFLPGFVATTVVPVVLLLLGSVA
ncbi:type II secretion system F family protein [Phycicoccus sonneratiae]|uniref:Type II secretion system F family protein n=1 Tax=Phycicoccus sonneratiae TaxID=2807628 RepID=A0ABS2CN99_9MICO|nr:type II secretion system F family protein [Phycicoccus sonneraticus]MBM6401357.1 type II secretion system F family protein [Phycicoccus sonneraticus]